jgi:hypothetical protein
MGNFNDSDLHAVKGRRWLRQKRWHVWVQTINMHLCNFYLNADYVRLCFYGKKKTGILDGLVVFN